MYLQNETAELPPLSPQVTVDYGVGIRDYVDLLHEGKATIVKAVLLAVLVTAVYLVLAPRTYKADTLLRIDRNKALLAATLRSEANPAPATAESPRAQREVEILRSRSVLGKVVDDLNLVVESSPRYFPAIGETLARKHDAHDGLAAPWLGLSRWAWGGEKLKVATFTVPDRYLDEEFTLIALAEGRFRLLSPKDEVLADGTVGEWVNADMGEAGQVTLKLTELKANPGTQFELTRKTSLAAIETLQKAS
jgi:tyrosine-protein kinase Etk/Wzc